MKQALYKLFVNIIFGSIIIAIALTVTTISLAKKMNDYKQQFEQGITATVEKDDIPVLGLGKGIISKVDVLEGQQVKKDQVLVELTNPVLEQQLKALKEFPNNLSAQTEATLVKTQLQYNTITSPVDGVVDSVSVTINSPVDEYSKIMTIYANQNTRLLTYLTIEQYVTAQKMARIPAFNPRLNQDFYVAPDILKPDQQDPNSQNQPVQPDLITPNKVALYLKLLNPQDALSLLNGEQLQLRLAAPQQQISKPIDVFVNFWNGLIK
jgi:hypothetical protein